MTLLVQRVLTGSIAFTLVAILAAGCMLDPGDGEHVAATSDSITFTGYSWNPNETVTVEYKRYGQWQALGTTRSASSPATVQGITGYRWTASFQVPSSGWVGCGSDTSAEIRTRTAGGLLHSVVPDWVGCWTDNGSNWSGFISNCFGPNDPIARLTSYRYCGGGGGGGLVGGIGGSSCSESGPCQDYPTGCGPTDITPGFEPILVDGVWGCVNGQAVCEFKSEGTEGNYCTSPYVDGVDPISKKKCGFQSDALCDPSNTASDCYPSTQCKIQDPAISNDYRCNRRLDNQQIMQECFEFPPSCWRLSEKHNLCIFDDSVTAP